MAEKGKERAAKRSVDKWKKKVWYEIYSPAHFERKPIGETIATKPEHLLGRVIGVSGRELANQASRAHVKLLFRINDVKGNKAYTEAEGHDIGGGYMRRFTRRRTSKIEVVQDIPLSKGHIRVKTVCLTMRKSAREKEAAIRKVVEEQMGAFVKGMEPEKALDALVFGNIAGTVSNEARKIVPIKRVEVVKSRIIRG
ncbi:MAG: hypothetical protein V1676_02820 [Candidatus Diapherotrites archaeon]